MKHNYLATIRALQTTLDYAAPEEFWRLIREIERLLELNERQETDARHKNESRIQKLDSEK